jgi:hypothetical protein
VRSLLIDQAARLRAPGVVGGQSTAAPTPSA